MQVQSLDLFLFHFDVVVHEYGNHPPKRTSSEIYGQKIPGQKNIRVNKKSGIFHDFIDSYDWPFSFQMAILTAKTKNKKNLGIHSIQDSVSSHECALRITLIDNTGRFYEISNISKDF